MGTLSRKTSQTPMRRSWKMKEQLIDKKKLMEGPWKQLDTSTITHQFMGCPENSEMAFKNSMESFYIIRAPEGTSSLIKQHPFPLSPLFHDTTRSLGPPSLGL